MKSMLIVAETWANPTPPFVADATAPSFPSPARPITDAVALFVSVVAKAEWLELIVSPQSPGST
jgi:hypothetical protein